MNFFEHQDRARRRTRLLVVLFILAVVSIVAVVDLTVLIFLGFGGDPAQPLFSVPSLQENAHLLIWVSLLTAGAIGLTSLFRILTLHSGGGGVARSLGGVLVSSDTGDPHLQRLRNVVEEMAIASGVPVPEIYVLEKEEGINAFAAGYSPTDAAIAVTRGALHSLSRAELQGVVAHEFSHILNGDMRLNIRLMGILFGILVLAMIGRLMLSVRHSRTSKVTAAVVAIGLALIITGYVGLFFGRLIRASVSRQREFLADASAVQFTREPGGIAGALKKIGAAQAGSTLTAETEEIGHMLFASGLSRPMLATHPPLVERIRAIEPGFDPSEIESIRERLPRHHRIESGEVAALGVSGNRRGGPMLDVDQVIGRIGQPDMTQIQAAAHLARAIPMPLVRAARSNDWAIAMICYLLIDSDQEIRDRQLLMIAEALGTEGERQVSTLLSAAPSLAADLRIPLMEIGFPSLRRRPAAELRRLLALIERLIHADGRIDVFEYALARLLSQQILDAIDPADARSAGTSRLSNREPEARDLLVILAIHGNPDQRTARAAYTAGLAVLGTGAGELEHMGPNEWPERLDKALAALDSLRMEDKQRLLRALLATARHAGVNQTEMELLRAIVAALHVPMPVLG